MSQTADILPTAHPGARAEAARAEAEQTGATCPVCGKAYQRPNVNTADYRIEYIETGTLGHMCAACWRTRPVL